jgi:hypothetical protein
MLSSAIRNIHYDPSTQTLSVWFVPSGDRYDNADLEPGTYAAFKAAPSKVGSSMLTSDTATASSWSNTVTPLKNDPLEGFGETRNILCESSHARSGGRADH